MKKGLVRVLAIDPNTRGFGFVVLEGPDTLIDWGIKDIREDKEAKAIQKLAELLRLYRPRVLVVESCDDLSSRRSPRTRNLIEKMAALAKARRIRVARIPVAKVRAVFAREAGATKEAITWALAKRFPELRWYRPPVRKPWMSEDQRQAMFDAAALATAFLALEASRNSS